MTKKELTELMRPIIKKLVQECVREALLEDGMLSKIIAETVSGLTANQRMITERQMPVYQETKNNNDERMRERLKEQKESRKKLLDAIGMPGDVFAGTKPLHESRQAVPGAAGSVPSPLAGIAPDDAGVDLSKLLGSNMKFKIKE